MEKCVSLPLYSNVYNNVGRKSKSDHRKYQNLRKRALTFIVNKDSFAF